MEYEPGTHGYMLGAHGANQYGPGNKLYVGKNQAGPRTNLYPIQGHKYHKYHEDGTGRDTYILNDSGG